MLATCAAAALASPAAAQHMHAGHVAPQPAPPPAAEPSAVSADDWAADRYFDPAVMARAREALVGGHGGGAWPMAMANLAEVRGGPNGGGYHWEAEASVGGDLRRLVLKTEGEGERRGKLERGEAQLLYSRAIGPYYNLQAGVRQDVVAHGRTYATLGVEGVAPYFIETAASLFLSDRGDLLVRGEAYSDLRLTQRLVLQPRVEVNLAASDMPKVRVGAGLSEAELGLRLRYEVSRRLAPYVGVAWNRHFGNTGRYRKADGERARQTSLVCGLRAAF